MIVLKRNEVIHSSAASSFLCLNSSKLLSLFFLSRFPVLEDAIQMRKCEQWLSQLGKLVH